MKNNKGFSAIGAVIGVFVIAILGLAGGLGARYVIEQQKIEPEKKVVEVLADKPAVPAETKKAITPVVSQPIAQPKPAQTAVKQPPPPDIAKWAQQPESELLLLKYLDFDGDGINEILFVQHGGMTVLKFDPNPNIKRPDEITGWVYAFGDQFGGKYFNFVDFVDLNGDGKKEVLFTYNLLGPYGASPYVRAHWGVIAKVSEHRAGLYLDIIYPYALPISEGNEKQLESIDHPGSEQLLDQVPITTGPTQAIVVKGQVKETLSLADGVRTNYYKFDGKSFSQVLSATEIAERAKIRSILDRACEESKAAQPITSPEGAQEKRTQCVTKIPMINFNDSLNEAHAFLLVNEIIEATFNSEKFVHSSDFLRKATFKKSAGEWSLVK